MDEKLVSLEQIRKLEEYRKAYNPQKDVEKFNAEFIQIITDITTFLNRTKILVLFKRAVK